MNQWVSILLILLWTSCVTQQSHASVVDSVVRLSQPHNLKPNQITDSPSPSPIPSADLKSEGSINSPERVKACDVASYDRCKINEYNITACVASIGNGSQGSFLLIVNDGESSLKLNISVRPTNETLEKNITVLAHKVEKVNITSYIGRSSSISVNAENGDCIIQLGASVPQAFYTVYLSPVNATYVLFVTVLFIGGTLVCCKLVKRERHLDGVPYRELEMGHQESGFSLNVGTTDGWEESWEDDWDVEKAV